MTNTEAAVRKISWCVLTCALALPSCGTPPSAQIELDAYSWWRRPSERGAFDNILSIYNDQHKDYEATNPITQNNADEVRKTLTARLLAQAPPSTFQANLGADVMRWSVVDATNPDAGIEQSESQGGVESSSRILPLTDFYDKNQLKQVLPDALWTELTRSPNGHPYTVPVDIHRLNMLYYNTKALTAFRQRTGKSFLDRETLCPPDVLDGSNTSAKLDVKIAIGLGDSFALTLVTFESLLPALFDPNNPGDQSSGAQIYDDLFRGNAHGDWQTPVRRALRCMQYLSRSFLDEPDDNWADALAKVSSNDADFSIMGDWSNGELKSSLEAGIVDGQPVPGSELTYVFTSDTFPLPVGAPHSDQAEALLGVIASRQGQLAFSQEKGSIPARTDVDLTELGPRAVRAAQDFAAFTKVLATSGLFPPYFPGDTLTGYLRAMIGPNPDPDAIENAVQLLSDSQPLFRRWQNRILVNQ